MPVAKIVDRELTIIISDPRIQEALAPLNSNGDDRISVDDFYVIPKTASITKKELNIIMRRSISNILSDAGFLKKSQQFGFEKFFDVYNNAKQLDILMKSWNDNNIDTYGSEMEFDKSYWDEKVAPFIVKGGLVGWNISHELFLSITSLSGKQYGQYVKTGTGCGGRIKGFEFNKKSIPEFMKKSVDEVVAWWNVSTAKFYNFDSEKGYRQVECDGKDCGIFDSGIRGHYINFIKMTPSDKDSLIKTGYCNNF